MRFLSFCTVMVLVMSLNVLPALSADAINTDQIERLVSMRWSHHVAITVRAAEKKVVETTTTRLAKALEAQGINVSMSYEEDAEAGIIVVSGVVAGRPGTRSGRAVTYCLGGNDLKCPWQVND